MRLPREEGSLPAHLLIQTGREAARVTAAPKLSRTAGAGGASACSSAPGFRDALQPPRGEEEEGAAASVYTDVARSLPAPSKPHARFQERRW